MLQKKYYLSLGNEEFSILVHSLIRLENSLIPKGSPNDLIDDVIMKVIAASVKKFNTYYI